MMVADVFGTIWAAIFVAYLSDALQKFPKMLSVLLGGCGGRDDGVVVAGAVVACPGHCQAHGGGCINSGGPGAHIKGL